MQDVQQLRTAVTNGHVPLDVVEPFLTEPFTHAPHRLVDLCLQRLQLFEDFLECLVQLGLTGRLLLALL